MLGKLLIPLTAKTHFVVAGGPSFEAATYPEMTFVKMAKEINVPCAISIPTRDFDVPDPAMMAIGLAQAVTAVLEGKPLYVGCMAGKGRTGLFLAILARAFEVPAPVAYVRKNYYPHAVETDAQFAYVMNFQIPYHITKAIARSRLITKLLFWRKGNLTNR